MHLCRHRLLEQPQGRGRPGPFYRRRLILLDLTAAAQPGPLAGSGYPDVQQPDGFRRLPSSLQPIEIVVEGWPLFLTIIGSNEQAGFIAVGVIVPAQQLTLAPPRRPVHRRHEDIIKLQALGLVQGHQLNPGTGGIVGCIQSIKTGFQPLQIQSKT